MNGVACNGWRFWNVEGGETPLTDAERLAAEVGRATTEPKPSKTTKAAKPARKTVLKQIKKVANQKGLAEGQARWHCSACMDGFLYPSSETPEVCPNGHQREVEDEFASPGGEATTSD